MKDHRVWTTIIAYFRKIPIDKALINQIQSSLDNNENILVMIKKEDPKSNPKYTQEEKFQELNKLFPLDKYPDKIIFSKIPDISCIINRRF